MKEVFAECAACNRIFQVTVGRGDDSHVAAHRDVVSDALEHPLLQNAQELYLHRRAHVADFVEEQRAALGNLETALTGGYGARERTLLMSEQLGLEKIRGDGAAIDRYERPVAPGAQVVDGAGGYFLAGAGFAEHEHSGIVACDLPKQPDDFTNRNRCARGHAHAALVRLGGTERANSIYRCRCFCHETRDVFRHRHCQSLLLLFDCCDGLIQVLSRIFPKWRYGGGQSCGVL